MGQHRRGIGVFTQNRPSVGLSVCDSNAQALGCRAMVSSPLDAARMDLVTRFGRNYEPGDVVYSEGDPAERAYLVHSGRVRIVKKIGAVERSLRVLNAGEVFGESGLLPHRKHEATAICLAACALIEFDANSFVQLMAHQPGIGVEVLQQLVLRAREAEDRIEISLIRDSQSRVIIGLLHSAQHLPGRETDAGLRLGVTPLELSARVGLDVESVKRTVQQLRENDYVRIVEQHIEIPSLQALQELRNLLDARDEILGGDPD